MGELDTEDWCHYSGMPSPNYYSKVSTSEKRETRILNLIRFIFLFNNLSILGSDSEYLCEKWSTYIGELPEKMDSLTLDRIRDSDDPIKKFLLTWSTQWGIGEYNKCREILYFILLTNHEWTDVWRPTEIIQIFEKINRPFESIKCVSGPKLHTLLESGIQKWLSQKDVRRDWNLIILGI